MSTPIKSPSPYSPHHPSSSRNNSNNNSILFTFSQIRQYLFIYLLIIAIITMMADTGFFLNYELSRFHHDFIDMSDHVTVPRPHPHHSRNTSPQEAREAKKKKRQIVKEMEQVKKELHKNEQQEYLNKIEQEKKQKERAEKAKEWSYKKERDTHKRRETVFAKEILEDAGINTKLINQTIAEQLPTYGAVLSITGAVKSPPVLFGQETCEQYRQRVPAEERMIGPAGMFNTGTNVLNHLMKRNCFIRARVEKYGNNATMEELGMRWQVPWGKHNPAGYKWTHITKRASKEYINTQFIFPVITVRHPYNWMNSMCSISYTTHFGHVDKCPHIKKRVHDDPNNVSSPYHYDFNPVKTQYADGLEEDASIAHLWNKWNKGYHKAHYPRIFVRYEDLVFYPKQTITQVCECVGGELIDQEFQYIIGDAHGDAHTHDLHGAAIDPYQGIIKAMVHNNKPMAPSGGWKKVQYEAAVEVLDGQMMNDFGYVHPRPRDREA